MKIHKSIYVLIKLKLDNCRYRLLNYIQNINIEYKYRIIWEYVNYNYMNYLTLLYFLCKI